MLRGNAGWRAKNWARPCANAQPLASRFRGCTPTSARLHHVITRVAADEVVVPDAAPDNNSTPENDDDLVFDVPDWIHERNKQFADEIKGKLILAPLTKGMFMAWMLLYGQLEAMC